MQEAVYRVIGVVCAAVAGTPIGTNPGPVHRLWLPVSGRLPETRGAVIPGLSAAGLAEPAVRRAWAAPGHGDRSSAAVPARWRRRGEQAGVWQAQESERYRAVAVDATGSWRPRLRGCATSHHHGPAGEALPAMPVGIAARAGRIGAQRLGLPPAFVRAAATEPSTAAHERALLKAAAQAATDRDALVWDAGFEIRPLQAAGATRYVVRAAQDVTGRRATPPAYSGRGRPGRRGASIRPLARTHRGRGLPASAPDSVVTWQEGDAAIRAEGWDDPVLPDVPRDRPTPRLVVLHDPRRTEPPVLATTLAGPPPALRARCLDRRPVERLPRAAEQRLGAARAFVSAPETRRRLPEFALLAGSILAHLAAARPAVPTGSRDRRPRPAPGRLRRVLAHTDFPTACPLPDRIRQKAAVSAHLPTGFWGQRRPPSPIPDASGTSPPASAQADVA